MVQKDPSNDAIEELEGDELRKSVESSDAVAVFICKKLIKRTHFFHGFYFRFPRRM